MQLVNWLGENWFLVIASIAFFASLSSYIDARTKSKRTQQRIRLVEVRSRAAMPPEIRRLFDTMDAAFERGGMTFEELQSFGRIADGITPTDRAIDTLDAAYARVSVSLANDRVLSITDAVHALESERGIPLGETFNVHPVHDAERVNAQGIRERYDEAALGPAGGAWLPVGQEDDAPVPDALTAKRKIDF